MFNEFPSGAANQGVQKVKDDVGRTHFRPTTTTSARCERFRKSQCRVLKGHVAFRSQLAAVAAHLVLFDAVATRKSLSLALVSLPIAFTWRGRVCLQWLQPDGRQDARHLSSLTVRHLEADRDAAISREAADQAIREAATALYPTEPDPLRTWFLDAEAWLLANLPGALLGHIIGTNPQCALPRTTLAREATRQALVVPAPSDSDGHAAAALGAALEGYFDAAWRSGSAWLVDKIVEVTRRNRRLDKAADKRRMLDALLTLAPRAMEADSISALLLAWAIDTVESGTPREQNADPGTIAKYFREAPGLLRAAFMTRDPGTLSAQELWDSYEGIKASATTDKRTLACALACWHTFLVRWLDAPILRDSLYLDVGEPLPRANVLWPHELEVVGLWLENAQGGERLLSQLKACFAIGGDARIRAGELFGLRLRNFGDFARNGEISITGPTKTSAGRRVLVIEGAEAQQTVQNWLTRRRREGAVGEDLLFGDPQSPGKVYRLGRLYVALNQLIRTVSGDWGTSFHTLSHTWISEKVREALIVPVAADVNPLDDIARAAGHVTAQTSLTHYAHRFEEPLRFHLDVALARIPLSSKEASVLSGVSADALRWRTHVRKADCQEIYWEAILALRPTTLPGAEVGVATAVPVPPSVVAVRTPAGFPEVLAALTDLAAGTDPEATSLRIGVDAAWVEAVAVAATEVLRDMRYQRLPSVQRGMTPIDAAKVLRFLNVTPEAGIDFRRTGQSKYASLLRYFKFAAWAAEDRVAVQAWLKAYQGRRVALDDATATGALLRLLHVAGVPASHLYISIGDADPLKPSLEARQIEAALATAFSQRFGIPPRVDWKLLRRGQPRVFLGWSSIALDDAATVPGAASSMAGFNAILFAAAVFLYLGDEGTLSR